MTNDFKDKLISILFAFILIIIMILNIIKKDDKISYTERRQLEQFPKITFKSIFDKTLADKLDKYTTDQFIGRDNLRKTKVNIEMITKNNYNNFYFNGPKDFLSYCKRRGYSPVVTLPTLSIYT